MKPFPTPLRIFLSVCLALGIAQAAGSGITTVDAPAPIERVTVQAVDGIPPRYVAYVQSGLPSGCAQHKGYAVTRSGDRIQIAVTNTVPAPDSPVACTMIYGIHESRIDLGTNFEPGRTYQVRVNNFETMFVANRVAGGSSGADRVTEPAPVVDIRLDVTPGADADFVVVTSALLDSCYEFGTHSAEAMPGGFAIDIRNYRNDLRYAETTATGVRTVERQEMLCGEVYRTVETRFPVSMQACQVYGVMVNGRGYRLQAIAPNVRCATPEEAISVVAIPSDLQSVPALVLEALAVSTRSIPPQHQLTIAVELGGCFRFHSYTLQVDGRTIRVTVNRLAPISLVAVCTADYRVASLRIPLGSDFAAGEYTVIVNEHSQTTFSHVTSLTPVPPDAGTATPPTGLLDRYFSIGLGNEVAGRVGAQDVAIRFEQLIEDSRCPANVLCVQMGQARILLGVFVNTVRVGGVELTVRPDAVRPTRVTAHGMHFELARVQPYPGTFSGVTPPAATATLLVSQVDRPLAEPRLQVRTEPVPGSPRTVRIVATLTGGADNDPMLYCQGLTWDFGDGPPLTAIPGCLVWTPSFSVQRSFEMTHTYEQAGTYAISFTYGPLTPGTTTIVVN